jgi:hypothetical protein
MGRKRSEIVRLALRGFPETSSAAGARPADRVKGLIGSLESGLPDLTEKHQVKDVDSLRRRR